MIKSLVLSIQVFPQFAPQKLSISYVDQIWRHSTQVAHAARKIALFEKAGQQAADDAFTAGLLHDLGKLILTAEFPEKYREALERARAGALSVTDIEKEVFGATHGEISACLLVNWGLPLSLGEAAAYHHHPSRCEGTEFGIVCAVHAADALVHETETGNDGPPYDPIDERYLAQLGLLGHSQLWREALAPKAPPKPGAQPEPEMSYIPARPPKPSDSPSRSSSGATGFFKRLAFWKKG